MNPRLREQFCNVCGKSFLGKAALTNHVRGREHQKRMKAHDKKKLFSGLWPT